MSMHILERLDGTIIHAGEFETVRQHVEFCCKKNISLNGAFLNRASLDRASLNGASLDGSFLDEAFLDGSSLDRASLDRASLKNAILNGASLDGASLVGAKYSILSMLKIDFGKISDSLTLELMRWDAITCGTEKMTEWANNGPCPFDKLQREFYFKEKRELWEPGAPTMDHRQLWEALAKEKNIEV